MNWRRRQFMSPTASHSGQSHWRKDLPPNHMAATMPAQAGGFHARVEVRGAIGQQLALSTHMKLGRRTITSEYESTRDEERIVPGSSARRGHAHYIGVRLGRMGSVGRRLAVVDGLVGRVNCMSSPCPVGEAGAEA